MQSFLKSLTSVRGFNLGKWDYH